MLIDLTAHFLEMRRYRVWTKARLVRTIDPSGGQLRADEFGRLICYEDYDRQNIFGWTSVSIESSDYPINHRSLPDLTPLLHQPFLEISEHNGRAFREIRSQTDALSQ